jgi:FK506-binding protein 1
MTVETLEEISEGSGPQPKCGDKVVVHYSGYLATSVAASGREAKPFDCSRERGHAFMFTVGVGKVIQGWDDAMLTMSKGARRRILISHDDAYGERGRPPTIPPNSNLIFDIELLNINETLVEEGIRVRREEQLRVERFLKLQDQERAKEAREQQQPQQGASSSAGTSKRRRSGSSSSGSESDSSSSSSSSESERKRRKREKKEKRKRKHEKKRKDKDGKKEKREKPSSKHRKEKHSSKHRKEKKEKKRKRSDESD